MSQRSRFNPYFDTHHQMAQTECRRGLGLISYFEIHLCMAQTECLRNLGLISYPICFFSCRRQKVQVLVHFNTHLRMAQTGDRILNWDRQCTYDSGFILLFPHGQNISHTLVLSFTWRIKKGFFFFSLTGLGLNISLILRVLTFPKRQILDSSKPKKFIADDNFKFDENGR